MKKIAFLLVAFTFSLHFVAAQGDNKSKKNEKDKTDKSEKTVIDFGTGKKTTVTESSNDDGSLKNVIWIEAASLLAGYVSGGYERAINDHFSVEVGAGPAFQSVFNTLGDRAIMSLFNITPTADDGYWTSRGYTTSRISSDGSIIGFSQLPAGNSGFYALLEPKYYPNGNVFEGFFVASRLQYMTRKVAILAPDIALMNATNTDRIIPSQTEKLNLSYSTFDFVPHIGWTSQLGHVVFDYEGGVGVRFASSTNYDIGTKYDNVNGIITNELRSPYIQTAILPVFTAAFKLGFNF